MHLLDWNRCPLALAQDALCWWHSMESLSTKRKQQHILKWFSLKIHYCCAQIENEKGSKNIKFYCHWFGKQNSNWARHRTGVDVKNTHANSNSGSKALIIIISAKFCWAHFCGQLRQQQRSDNRQAIDYRFRTTSRFKFSAKQSSWEYFLEIFRHKHTDTYKDTDKETNTLHSHSSTNHRRRTTHPHFENEIANLKNFSHYLHMARVR